MSVAEKNMLDWKQRANELMQEARQFGPEEMGAAFNMGNELLLTRQTELLNLLKKDQVVNPYVNKGELVTQTGGGSNAAIGAIAGAVQQYFASNKSTAEDKNTKILRDELRLIREELGKRNAVQVGN